MENKIQCPYCKKYFSKYGIKNHIAIVHENKKDRIPDRTGASISDETRIKLSNAAKNKWKDESYREAVTESLTNNPNNTGTAATVEKENERKKKISNKMKNNKNWVNSIDVSGRGKKGRYNGIFFASTWELAYIIFCIDNNISFIRNTKKFKYEFNNEIHYYIPDFILEDGTYVEIKGFRSKQWEEKEKQFTEKLKVIDKEKIGKYIEYAQKKFGVDFYNACRVARVAEEDGLQNH